MLTFLFWAKMVCCFSQDIIVKHDTSELKVKVTEILEDVVKFKKFDFLDGPVYSISKKDVFLIVFQNGEREYFSTSSYKLNQKSEVDKPNEEKNSTVDLKIRSKDSNEKKLQSSLTLGLGSGIFLGSTKNNSAGSVKTKVPFVFARYDLPIKVFGESSSLYLGAFGSYMSYSFGGGGLGSFSDVNIIGFGPSATYLKSVNSKLRIGGGLRALYTSVSNTVTSGFIDSGAGASSLTFGIYGDLFYDISNKSALLVEIATGNSFINIGFNFNL